MSAIGKMTSLYPCQLHCVPCAYVERGRPDLFAEALVLDVPLTVTGLALVSIGIVRKRRRKRSLVWHVSGALLIAGALFSMLLLSCYRLA